LTEAATVNTTVAAIETAAVEDMEATTEALKRKEYL